MKKIITEALFGIGYELTEFDYEVMWMIKVTLLYISVFLLVAAFTFKITGSWDLSTLTGLILSTMLLCPVGNQDAN